MAVWDTWALNRRPAKMARSLSQVLQNAAIRPSQGKASAALVFLHGLGDTGHGWADILSQLDIPYMKIICPTAPVLPVTLNMGMRMPAWFDLHDLGEGRKYDEEGIAKAAQEIHGLLDSDQLEGLDPSRVVLGGFSMGGCLALASAYTYSKSLAGIVALSCWIPASFQQKLIKDMTANKETPVLQGHGDRDMTVQYQFGSQTADMIKSFNPHNHQFKTYKGMAHSSCPRELADVKEFITSVIPPLGKV